MWTTHPKLVSNMATMVEEATITSEEEGPEEEASNPRTVDLEVVATSQMMTFEKSARRL